MKNDAFKQAVQKKKLTASFDFVTPVVPDKHLAILTFASGVAYFRDVVNLQADAQRADRF